MHERGGWIKEVGVRAELRGTLVRAIAIAYIYECIMCRYVRLIALNVPHIPRPFFTAP